MQSEHLKTRVTHILRRQLRSCCRLDFQCSGDREEEEDYFGPKRVSVLRPSNQTNRSSSPPFSLAEPWQKFHAASHTPSTAFRHLPPHSEHRFPAPSFILRAPLSGTFLHTPSTAFRHLPPHSEHRFPASSSKLCQI